MRIENADELLNSRQMFCGAVVRLRQGRTLLLAAGCDPADIASIQEPLRTFLLGVLDDIREARRNGISILTRT